MAEATITDSVSRDLTPEMARRRVEAFRRRFGRTHLYFAYHAAFPLALTPDLLNHLWINFQRDLSGRLLRIPWVATADLLLSNLCKPVGSELFEMMIPVRNLLLDDLKADSRFGPPRLQELSAFLLAYIQQQLGSPDPYVRDFAETQRWTALAYTQPDQAAKGLAAGLEASITRNDVGEQLRLASVADMLDHALRNQFQMLISYARQRRSLIQGLPPAGASAQPSQATTSSLVVVAGVELPPVETNLPRPDTSFRIEALLRDARGAIEREDWSTTISKLRAIQALDANQVEAASLLTRALQESELDSLYKQGLTALDNRNYGIALEFFRQVQSLRAGYRDLDRLIAFAQGGLQNVSGASATTARSPALPIIDRSVDLVFSFMTEAEAARSYRVRVFNSAKDAQYAMRFDIPFSPSLTEALQSQLSDATRLEHSQELARDIGGRLFDALFPDDLRVFFRHNLNAARRDNGRLRIVLQLTESPELNSLPWEYLYDTERHGFLTLSSDVSIIRYIGNPTVRVLEPVKPPLRMLVVISSPKDFLQLDIRNEWDRLLGTLSKLEQQGLIVLELLDRTTEDSLSHKLREGDYHIIHYIGHMSKRPLLTTVESDDGYKEAVRVTYLWMIQRRKSQFRLMVVYKRDRSPSGERSNSLETALDLIRAGIPAVVTTQFEMTVSAEISFFREFYSALIQGNSLDTALNASRKAIYRNQLGVEWGAPQLYTSLLDGRPFDMDREVEKQPAVIDDDLAARLPAIEELIRGGKDDPDVLLKNSFPRQVANQVEFLRSNYAAAVGLWVNSDGTAKSLGSRRTSPTEKKLYDTLTFLFTSARSLAAPSSDPYNRQHAGQQLQADTKTAQRLWKRVKASGVISPGLDSQWRNTLNGLRKLGNAAIH